MAFLRTATGKEYPSDFMGLANEFVLYLQVDMELTEVLRIFQDPEETRTLYLINDLGETLRTETGFIVFTGFNLIRGEYPVRIRMTKKMAEE